MNNNQTSQQFKPDPKIKAILSLILGMITGGSIIILPLIGRLISPAMILMPLVPLIAFILGVIFPFFAIIGLILGIQGLKSIKRNFAIAGIVLCVIYLLVLLYYFLFD